MKQREHISFVAILVLVTKVIHMGLGKEKEIRVELGGFSEITKGQSVMDGRKDLMKLIIFVNDALRIY